MRQTANEAIQDLVDLTQLASSEFALIYYFRVDGDFPHKLPHKVDVIKAKSGRSSHAFQTLDQLQMFIAGVMSKR